MQHTITSTTHICMSSLPCHMGMRPKACQVCCCCQIPWYMPHCPFTADLLTLTVMISTRPLSIDSGAYTKDQGPQQKQQSGKYCNNVQRHQVGGCRKCRHCPGLPPLPPPPSQNQSDCHDHVNNKKYQSQLCTLCVPLIVMSGRLTCVPEAALPAA